MASDVLKRCGPITNQQCVCVCSPMSSRVRHPTEGSGTPPPITMTSGDLFNAKESSVNEEKEEMR